MAIEWTYTSEPGVYVKKDVPLSRVFGCYNAHSHILTYHLSEIGRLNPEGSHITVNHEPLVGPRLVVMMCCVCPSLTFSLPLLIYIFFSLVIPLSPPFPLVASPEISRSDLKQECYLHPRISQVPYPSPSSASVLCLTKSVISRSSAGLLPFADFLSWLFSLLLQRESQPWKPSTTLIRCP